MKKISFVIVLSALVFTACSDSSSVTAPQIALTSSQPIIGQDTICDFLMENVININAGDTLKLEFHATGENELSQLKIDIHENADCHDHAHKTVPFEKIIIKNLTGNEMHVSEAILIPSGAEIGNYHLDIQVLDQKGNQGNALEYHLKIN